MPAQERAVVEAEIGRILLEQWDPMNARENPEPYTGYAPYAHEVYSLLARGASDTQIARRLHQVERDDMQHPELVSRDLSTLVRTLRTLERQI
jgi:hypothetical protein